MFSEDDLRKFKSAGFGWLSPDGKLYSVQPFDHFKIFEELGLYADLLKQIEEMERTIEEEAEAFMEGIEPGEHPEWHRHDIWEDGYRSRIMGTVRQAIYNDGWARLGTRPSYGMGKALLEVEGAQEFIKVYEKQAQEIAEMLDYELRATYIAYTTY